MKTFKNALNKNQLNAYILTYCAKGDFKLSNQEAEFIKHKTKIESLDKINCEMNKYNDYQIIQKIKDSIDEYNYSNNELENLFNDMQEVIEVNNGYNALKQNIHRGLKHILM
ncbi:hypothetical protein [Aestuariivivens sp. NBU2969]|uniref:hypothetical protein n=1 Tax=Aestuariivivens sp. NBU2969 TaxID=2873267 RepID=UPI001CBBC6FD|nr:hypothetical protein [Aestuariivivens sp. NBU2969]